MAEQDQNRLKDALSRVRKRIEQVKIRRESIGEQNTKSILIDPILKALGWDPEELEEVCREYKRKPQDNPVDYALFLLRSPCLFVEAKALEKDLQDRKWISQILGYATVVGVEWCVLTNGDEYRVYNSHATVDIDEKLFRTIKVSDEAQEQFTLDTLDLLSKNKMGEKLINTLWKAHYIDHRVKAALADILSNEDGALARLVRKKIPGLSRAEIRDSLGRADFRIDFPALPAKEPVKSPASRKEVKKKAKPPVGVNLRDLIIAGLIKPPVDLECLYRKSNLKAVIQADGTILFSGSAYDSLSTAAGMARKSIIGAPAGRRYPQTNGWTFWKIRDSQTGEKIEIDVLRQTYLKSYSKGPRDR